MLEFTTDNIGCVCAWFFVFYGLYFVVGNAAKVAAKHPEEAMNGVRIVKALLKR